MLDLTFGTDADAQRIVDTINGIHDRINGRLGAATGIFPAGTPYSARDGRLLVWVHATLVDSLVLTYERTGRAADARGKRSVRRRIRLARARAGRAGRHGSIRRGGRGVIHG